MEINFPDFSVTVS